MPDGLDTSVEGGVLRLVLNRPEVYNALNETMADRLAEELQAANHRSDVRAVVLTGAGPAFCSGADVSGEDAHERFDVAAMERSIRMVRLITTLDKPVVAAVNGVAAGVGASLALAADLTIAASSASFLLAFARIGLMPDGGATASVAASVGRARAMRMALLAEPLSAADALTAGLIAEVVPDEQLASAVQAVVAQLVSGPPLAYAAIKQAINAATLATLDETFQRERACQLVLLRSEDAAEGMRAFSEKRPPVFRGE